MYFFCGVVLSGEASRSEVVSGNGIEYLPVNRKCARTDLPTSSLGSSCHLESTTLVRPFIKVSIPNSRVPLHFVHSTRVIYFIKYIFIFFT